MLCVILGILHIISNTYVSCTGRILEGGGRVLEGSVHFGHCQPLWAEPCIKYFLILQCYFSSTFFCILVAGEPVLTASKRKNYA